MRTWISVPVMLVVVVLSLASVLDAATPAREFPYSKQTTLAPGAYRFVFNLYDSRTAAIPLWSSGSVALTLKTPVLVYTLGSGTAKIPDTIDFSQQLYLEVAKTSPAPTVIIAKRERLPIVPYALWSATSDVPGVPGPQGPAGATGSTGATGPAGTFSAAACSEVQSDPVSLANYYTNISATCPAGLIAVSGGYQTWNWNTVNTCIPIRSNRFGTTTWTVVWGAANDTVCAANSALTTVLCCP